MVRHGCCSFLSERLDFERAESIRARESGERESTLIRHATVGDSGLDSASCTKANIMVTHFPSAPSPVQKRLWGGLIGRRKVVGEWELKDNISFTNQVLLYFVCFCEENLSASL